MSYTNLLNFLGDKMA